MKYITDAKRSPPQGCSPVRWEHAHFNHDCTPSNRVHSACGTCVCHRGAHGLKQRQFNDMDKGGRGEHSYFRSTEETSILAREINSNAQHITEHIHFIHSFIHSFLEKGEGWDRNVNVR